MKLIPCLIVIMVTLSGCLPHSNDFPKSIEQDRNINPNYLVEAPFAGWIEGLPKIKAPQGFNWRQFEGITLRMISENTPPSSALAANIDKFEEITGIKVLIEQSELSTVIEKVGLDFNAKAGNYHIIYADPYQILPRYAEHFEDLYKFEKDPFMPHIPGGINDFIESHLNVVSFFENNNRLLTLPYDATTMVLAYRKDVFQKYKDLFFEEMGFDWIPGPSLTWDDYYTIANWINEKVQDGIITEVKYGTGHQAKRHDSLMNDFSNILAANGGNFIEGELFNRIGTTTHVESAMDTKVALKSIEFYEKLIQISAPGSTSWDWNDLAREFAQGYIAMTPQWHEYSSQYENSEDSKVAGKVGWAILPKGLKRHAHTFGGTGIGINKYATIEEKKAAWLFLIWATSPQSQYMILKSKEGGSTPTRYSVYELPDVKRGMQPGTLESKQMPNLLPMQATFEAWKNENIYVRPKMRQWRQIDTFIFTELSKMIFQKQSPEKTAVEIHRKINQSINN
ncbi:extracellular solute-binding protein [Bacillus alveayuensis]|uniref:extracellular solute-binding protein n=1 Tax=Aeribacillus alveayuensis TaxID=279215 RepID=UPI000A408790|nr:extracellular solute-binding protein [Bacillus alveayuensis]